MKINYGKFKRRNLVIGDNKKMRPTQSLAKSIIFNSININSNSKVIDLFAGTGSLGFEAASAGAEMVYWVDNNFESVKAIQMNIDFFNLDKNKFIVFKSDFRMMLKKIKFKPTIIFLDPPFIAIKYYNEALEYIFNNNIISNEGIIVLEKPYKAEISSMQKFNIKKISIYPIFF